MNLNHVLEFASPSVVETAVNMYGKEMLLYTSRESMPSSEFIRSIWRKLPVDVAKHVAQQLSTKDALFIASKDKRIGVLQGLCANTEQSLELFKLLYPRITTFDRHTELCHAAVNFMRTDPEAFLEFTLERPHILNSLLRFLSFHTKQSRPRTVDCESELVLLVYKNFEKVFPVLEPYFPQVWSSSFNIKLAITAICDLNFECLDKLFKNEFSTQEVDVFLLRNSFQLSFAELILNLDFSWTKIFKTNALAGWFLVGILLIAKDVLQTNSPFREQSSSPLRFVHPSHRFLYENFFVTSVSSQSIDQRLHSVPWHLLPSENMQSFVKLAEVFEKVPNAYAKHLLEVSDESFLHSMSFSDQSILLALEKGIQAEFTSSKNTGLDVLLKLAHSTPAAPEGLTLEQKAALLAVEPSAVVISWLFNSNLGSTQELFASSEVFKSFLRNNIYIQQYSEETGVLVDLHSFKDIRRNILLYSNFFPFKLTTQDVNFILRNSLTLSFVQLRHVLLSDMEESNLLKLVSRFEGSSRPQDWEQVFSASTNCKVQHILSRLLLAHASSDKILPQLVASANFRSKVDAAVILELAFHTKPLNTLSGEVFFAPLSKRLVEEISSETSDPSAVLSVLSLARSWTGSAKELAETALKLEI